MDGFLFKSDNYEIFRDKMRILYPKQKQNDSFHYYDLEDSIVIFRANKKDVLIFPKDEKNHLEVALRLEGKTSTNLFGAISNQIDPKLAKLYPGKKEELFYGN